MKPLRSTDLNEQVEIRRATKADNGRGGSTTTWRAIATPWAAVKGLAGRESMQDRVLQGIQPFQLRLWWRDDLKPADQIRHAGLELNITSIADPFDTKRELLVLAETAGVQR